MIPPLVVPFGGPELREQPLLEALAHLIDKPVRVRQPTSRGDRWTRGVLDRVHVTEPVDDLPGSVVLKVADEAGTFTLRVATQKPGHLRWDCPRRRTLIVYVDEHVRMELHDNRAIRILDDIEQELAAKLADPDPVDRYLRLGALRNALNVLAQAEHDQEVRARLEALSRFLCEYVTP